MDHLAQNLRRLGGSMAFAISLLTITPWTGLTYAGGGAVHVSGYTRSNGTYVAPHYRSAPDRNFGNNWSTLGNVNPYTGKPGTLTSPRTTSSSSYVESSGVGQVTRPAKLNPGESQSDELQVVHSDKNKLPEHAQLDYSGRNWECLRGYRKSGNNCVPIVVPAHAKLDYFGHGWECDRDFRKVNSNCVPVTLPTHAKLDYFGHDWECESGYVKEGQSCSAVRVPEHAHLDYFGHGWECAKGYRKAGDGCAAVSPPTNARLDYFGHDWECVKGFKKSGAQCSLVQLPANARLDYFGHDWECNVGFRRSAGECVTIRRP
jgi:hypothetical protein